MLDNLHINACGLSIIKQYEGLYLKAYRCPSGILTIGYGHTREITENMVISEAAADEMLAHDCDLTETVLKRLIKVNIGENQFSSLVSFAFNIGTGNFQGSTLLRLLNNGWYDQVPAQMARWVRSGGVVLNGLTRRRASEGLLWNTPDAPKEESNVVTA